MHIPEFSDSFNIKLNFSAETQGIDFFLIKEKKTLQRLD